MIEFNTTIEEVDNNIIINTNSKDIWSTDNEKMTMGYIITCIKYQEELLDLVNEYINKLGDE